MAELSALHVYCGGPTTLRGEATRLGVDPTARSDDISYAAGRVAVVRSPTDALECSVFTLHTHPVTVVKIAGDGQYVLSGDEGGNIRLWDRKTMKQKVEEQVSGGPIRDVAMTADGKFAVVVGDARGSYAKCVKLPSAGLAGACSGHTKRVLCCDVAQTKPPMLVTGGEDMTVGLHKGPPVREFDSAHFLRHHKGFINDVKFSPQGDKLAVACTDRTVSIVDPKSFEILRTLEGHKSSATGVCWSSDGKRLLSSGNDKSNILWDVDAGTMIRKTEFGNTVPDMQVACAILPKSGRLASVSLSGDISFRDDDAAEADLVMRGHAKQIVGLAVVGAKAYSADYSGRLVAWDIGKGSSKKSFNGKAPTTVAALDANEDVVVNVGMDGNVFVTPVSSLEFPKPLKLKGGCSDVAVPRSTTAYSAAVVNESRVALVTPDGSDFLKVMDLPRSDKGISVAVATDGSMLAVGVEISGGSGEVRLFRVSGDSLAQEGDPIRSPSTPNRIAFSPDGKIIAVGEKGRRVKIYTVDDRSPVSGGGTGHTARIDALAFSADGKKLASGGMDGSIAIWLVDTDEDPVKRMAAHRNGVTGIAFVDDNTLLSSGSDSCLRSWKL